MDSKRQQLPDGLAPYPENSPFLDRVGPLFLKMDGMKPIIGLYICEHHCNNKGTAHGGLMATLADISLGKTAGWSQEPRVPLVTTSLTIDYFGAARLHDWIVAETDFNRVGSEMAFANCYVRSGDKALARASGVFKVVRLR